MKKTIILAITCLCMAAGAQAQRNTGRLSLGAGLLYRNGMDLTLAYEHEIELPQRLGVLRQRLPAVERL